ncbi:hypothetical protein IAR55_003201 [Kwoniella newhampshirensis]|uniref:ATP-binding cassette, subfamily B (MDR/TAP), member 1 n=1 Tax=Kwoniella newhampshirensis TaxID=1651941 RepID=A0AAW0YPP8_9TREE
MESANRVENGTLGAIDTPPLTAHRSTLPNALYILSFAPPLPSLIRDPSGFSGHPFILYGVGTLCATICGVSLPAFDMMFGYWTNGVNSTDRSIVMARGNECGWLMLMIGLVTWLTFAIFQYCFTMAGSKLSNSLREEYLAAIIVQDQAFYDRIGPGEVISRSSKDVSSVRIGLGERLGYLIWSTSLIVTALVSAFARAPRLAGILLCLIPIIFSFFGITGYYFDKVSQASDEIDGRASTLIEQGLSSVRIIQSFSIGSRLLAKLESDMFRTLQSLAIRINAIKGLQMGVVYGFGFIVYSLGFWYGSISITRGLAVGNLVTTIYNYTNLFFAFAAIVPHFVATSSAVQSLGNLRKQIERRPPIDVRDQSGLHLEQITGWQPSVELEGVTFAYPGLPTKKALDNITISIGAGQFTAFVGRSGSGKSTLAALLLRMYDPVTATEITSQDRAILESMSDPNKDESNSAETIVIGSGVVRFAGHDVRNVNITSLRHQIAVVQQNPQLVSGTVFDNVAIGLAGTDLEYRPDIDLADDTPKTQARLDAITQRVEDALRKAQAWDFVSQLPDGVKTVVSGGRTGVLSGGQVQRVAIARALVRRPRCLVLDEATSAVSADTEMEIQMALLREQRDRGMTLIAIAHRLSTVVAADRIIVMSAGHIVQTGTYDELLDPSCPDQTFRSLALPHLFQNESRKVTPQSTISAPVTVVQQPLASKEIHPSGHISEISPRPFPSAKTAFANIKFTFGISVLLGMVGGSTFVVAGWMTGRTIVSVSISDFSIMRPAADRWSLWFLILALAAALVVSTQAFGIEYSGDEIARELRRESFRALIKQEVAFFERKDSGSGTLTAAISQHPANVGNFIGLILSQIISTGSNLIATLIMAFVLNWRLAVMVIPTLAVNTSAGYINFKCHEKFEGGLNRKTDMQSEYISEAVNSLSLISSLSREAEVVREFKAKFIGGTIETRWLITCAWTLGFCQAMLDFFGGLMFWWGARQIARGTAERADVFSVLESVLTAVYISAKIFTYTGDFTRMKKSLEIIDSWITRVPQMGPITSSAPAEYSNDKATQGIEFDRVELRYPSRPQVLALAGISLKMESNKSYAFCGTSGAGKSSVLAILQRFYEATSGRILLDGRDIRHLEVDELRSQMGYVSQEPILYSMSIRWNLTCGSPMPESVTNEQLEDACRQACILDFIQSLPHGFDTEIGMKGGQLSGGQKQRICIARALIRDPQILLLDEATSALDGESEARVQEALENASRGRITVHIAHRLSTIRKADVIFVMELGSIVESGTHEELIAIGGRYRELVDSQL